MWVNIVMTIRFVIINNEVYGTNVFHFRFVLHHVFKTVIFSVIFSPSSRCCYLLHVHKFDYSQSLHIYCMSEPLEQLLSIWLSLQLLIYLETAKYTTWQIPELFFQTLDLDFIVICTSTCKEQYDITPLAFELTTLSMTPGKHGHRVNMVH